ncbi:bifunctional ADP-dependent NAD(P)H-hydrate dehydratase/NAD(P)H-hydrate epimerase, partial [Patescibacteria group bacterium]|nr:bifunctional ADP-dependent NAD(P)H-hydrate dehydratase/NAD(P)H-hydrate epimerase [Patescibacteria group bacterium]
MKQELTKDWVAGKLPKRPKEANKGTFGKLLVSAGSEQFPGAAYLVCAAAYRVGAGLVTLATEPQVKIIVSKKLPEVTFLSTQEVFGKIEEY